MRFVIALAAVVAITLAASIQKEEDSLKCGHYGSQNYGCQGCRRIMKDGEGAGAAYSMEWLEHEISHACQNMPSPEYYKQFMKSIASFDQYIRAGTDPKSACYDMCFC